MTLEEKIRNCRKQEGISQEKMAELIGVSRQAITKWENGTGTPDIANLVQRFVYRFPFICTLLIHGYVLSIFILTSMF